jgi:hypothetical protein
MLIGVFGDDGPKSNTQIVTADVVRRTPLVAPLLDVAMKMGPEPAREIMDSLNKSRQHHK